MSISQSIDFHHVDTVNIYTKKSGNTSWTNFVLSAKDGSAVEITVFHDDEKPINLVLGESND